jgi:hypothetical protein
LVETCFRQLDLAPFDRFIWPHLVVNPLSAPGRSEALRRPKGDAFRAQRRPGAERNFYLLPPFFCNVLRNRYDSFPVSMMCA